MKKALLAVLVLLIMVMVYIAGIYMGATSTASFVGYKKQMQPLSVSMENQRMKDLGLESAGEGNAADIYIEYVKKDAPIAKEQWLEDARHYESDQAADREKVARAVELASPHLDKIIKASRMKECKMWGPYFKPDPELTYFAQEIPEYIHMMRLGELLVTRGAQLGEAGEIDRALEHYRALIRIGHHLEAEPVIIGHMLGIALKKMSAKALADFNESRGLKDEAEKWKLYFDLQDLRQVAFMSYTLSAPKWDQDLTAAFIEDEDIPYSYRLEALAIKRMCGEAFGSGSKVAIYACIITGPPGWIDPLVDKFGAQDEISGQFAKVIKAHDISFDDLSAIGLLQ